MSDLISRQAAIDAILGMFLNIAYSEKNIAWSMALDKIRQLPSAEPDGTKGVFISDITVEMFRNASLEGVETLMAEGDMYDIVLPSVQPERKTGWWIDTGSGQECSKCHEIQYGYDSGRFYCPNCGAKMDDEKEIDFFTQGHLHLGEVEVEK